MKAHTEGAANVLLNFWNDPANSNYIAIIGWAGILYALYTYLFGAPKFQRKSTTSTNYQQQETSESLTKREDHLKKLEEKLNATAAERRAQRERLEEGKRKEKAQIAAEKHAAMQAGQHFAGASWTTADDEEDTKKIRRVETEEK